MIDPKALRIGEWIEVDLGELLTPAERARARRSRATFRITEANEHAITVSAQPDAPAIDKPRRSRRP